MVIEWEAAPETIRREEVDGLPKFLNNGSKLWHFEAFKIRDVLTPSECMQLNANGSQITFVIDRMDFMLATAWVHKGRSFTVLFQAE